MEKVDIVEVINLCASFKNTVEALVQANPDAYHEKAVLAMTPHMDEIQDLLSDITASAMGAMFSDASELEQDKDFQDKNIRVLELIAITAPEILEADKIWAAMPDGLRGNSEAAQLLRDRDAPQMADLCLMTPE